MNRLHPEDLRALVASNIAARNPTVYGPQPAVQAADELLAELKRTENPEAQGPFDKVVPRDRVDEIIRRAESAEAERDALRVKCDGAESALALADQALGHERDAAAALRAEVEALRAKLEGSRRCPLCPAVGAPRFVTSTIATQEVKP